MEDFWNTSVSLPLFCPLQVLFIEANQGPPSLLLNALEKVDQIKGAVVALEMGFFERWEVGSLWRSMKKEPTQTGNPRKKNPESDAHISLVDILASRI